LDRNYGAWLIIWDRMFGTFQEEKEDEEIVYGLVDQAESFNPLYLQVLLMLAVFAGFFVVFKMIYFFFSI
jgi:alkylglycerol monooxygenase